MDQLYHLTKKYAHGSHDLVALYAYKSHIKAEYFLVRYLHPLPAFAPRLIDDRNLEKRQSRFYIILYDIHPASETEQAFRYMQSGKNTGKTVVEIKAEDQVLVSFFALYSVTSIHLTKYVPGCS